jgi:hypothetical protein
MQRHLIYNRRVLQVRDLPLPSLLLQSEDSLTFRHHFADNGRGVDSATHESLISQFSKIDPRRFARYSIS